MKRIYPPPVNDPKQEESTGGLSGVWQRWFATTAQHIKSDQPLIAYYEGVFADFQTDPIDVLSADLTALETDIGNQTDDINALGTKYGYPKVTCHVTGSRSFNISASSHNDFHYSVNIQGEGVVSSDQYAVAYDIEGLTETGLVFVVNCRNNSFLEFYAYNTTGSSISDYVTFYYTIIGYTA